ncbi:X-domain of DnaJ-containing-domain-containing protein [Gautieria morchelliformis]|nr:X-domain of DnaJ-containing-domain-containing protein [Gautieria morchelliformis]
MAPVDSEYYDLLGVSTEVDDLDLKKAYRKQAIRFHPDKNPSPEAEEKFKDISKAYQVLSDPNLRAVYDRNGKSMVDKEGGASMEDAAGFFANVFGGDRFVDYIGEISLMKEMTSVASTMMTDEEKADIERELKGKGASPAVTPSAHAGAHGEAVHETTVQSILSTEAEVERDPEARQHSTLSAPSSGSPTPSAASKEKDSDIKEMKERRRQKPTPEQKQKLEALEKERREAMEKRVKELHQKLVERLRPFVEATNPGHPDDLETKAFEERMRKEAEDLKFESFGVELLHTIGNVYMMKATSFMKSRKFLGIPGFFSRLKEKGTLAKDAWGVIGSALGVQASIEQMARLQEKGEIPEEQMRDLETDVTGKILLASWRGTRFEVINVLRQVCDLVLKAPGVSDETLTNRAKGLLITGAIFKQTVADESDEERRALERMVAEAAATPKKRRRDKLATHGKADGGSSTVPPENHKQ